MNSIPVMLMAPVIFVLSSTFGMFASVVDVTLLGGGLWGAVGTYFLVSLSCCRLLGSAAWVSGRRAAARSRHAAAQLRKWQEWHSEEDMETSQSYARMDEDTPRKSESA